jgi:hypothetical protein
MRFLAALAVVFLPAVPAWSQTAVEHAVISGASAAGAAPASAVGKSVGGILNGVSKSLEQAQKSSAAAPAAPAAASAPAGASVVAQAPAPVQQEAGKAASGEPAAKAFVPKPIDPTQVSIGQDRAELIEKCGPPSMTVSQKKDSSFVETYWYATATRVPFVITLRDGKVTAFTPPH